MLSMEPLKPVRPLRLSERKSVTVAIGFLCYDGVLIAADRKISAVYVTGSNHSFSEKKITHLVWKNGRAVLGYAGNRDTCKEFYRILSIKFGLNVSLNEEEAREALKASLAEAIREKEEFSALAGIWLNEAQPNLWCVSSDANGAIRVRDASLVEIIGSADSGLSRYLITQVTSTGTVATIQEASIYAVWILSQLPEYDSTVGGGIDLARIEHNERLNRPAVRTVSPEETQKWELEINLLHREFISAFGRATDLDAVLDASALYLPLQRYRDWVASVFNRPNLDAKP